MRMRRIILLSVACPAQSYFFPHYLTNGTIFEKKESVIELKIVFGFSLQFLSETFVILRIMQRDTTINVHRSSF